MFKKICINLLLLVAILFIPITTVAIDSNLIFNERPIIKLKHPVLIEDDVTYLPLAEIFSNMGASVSWDGTLGLVTINYNGQKILLKLNSKEGSIDKKSITLRHPTIVKEGCSYIAESFLTDYFKYIVRKEEDKNSISIYVLSMKSIASYLNEDFHAATDSNPLSANHYLLSYPDYLNKFTLSETHLAQVRLYFNKSLPNSTESIKAFQGSYIISGIEKVGGNYNIKTEPQEIDYVYRKYEERSLLNNLNTYQGSYGLFKYKESPKIYIYDQRGRLIGFNQDKEEGLLLIKNEVITLGKKLGTALENQQKYIFVDGKLVLIINWAGQLVEDKRLQVELQDSMIYDLGNADSYLVMGSTKSKSGNLDQIYCEYVGLPGTDKKVNWYIVKASSGSNLKVVQLNFNNEKAFYIAKSSTNWYLGMCDNKENKIDLNKLPDWIDEAQILTTADNIYLHMRDDSNIYISQILTGTNIE